MAVPVSDDFIAFVALNFSDEIALDRRDGVLTDHAVLAPLVQVLAVEVGVERLGEEVEVDIVELEKVEHVHAPDSRHYKS